MCAIMVLFCSERNIFSPRTSTGWETEAVHKSFDQTHAPLTVPTNPHKTSCHPTNNRTNQNENPRNINNNLFQSAFPTYPGRVDAATQTDHVDSTTNLLTVQEVMDNILYPIKKSGELLNAGFDFIFVDTTSFIATKIVDFFFQAFERLDFNGKFTVNLTFFGSSRSQNL